MNQESLEPSPIETHLSQVYNNPTPAGSPYGVNPITENQKRLLAAYIVEGTLPAACREAHIALPTHYQWIRENASYRKAFQEVADASLQEARARLDVLLPRAAEVYEEGLEADTSMDVSCPRCEHEFKVRVPNYTRRLAVAKDLFKRSGDLAAKVTVQGEVKHRDMALEDRLALAQVTAWEANGKQGSVPVPPDVYDDLRRRGLLESGPGSVSPRNVQIDAAIKAQARQSDGWSNDNEPEYRVMDDEA